MWSSCWVGVLMVLVNALIVLPLFTIGPPGAAGPDAPWLAKGS